MRRLLLPAALLSLVTVAAAALTLAFGDRFAAGQVITPPLPVDPGQVIPGTSPLPVDPGQVVPPVPQQLALNVGDTIRVNGADIGCQVTDRDGRPTIECRRVTSPERTYGTFINERRAIVGRFHSSGAAQVVLTARHGGRWRACRAAARASRASGSGCR